MIATMLHMQRTRTVLRYSIRKNAGWSVSIAWRRIVERLAASSSSQNEAHAVPLDACSNRQSWLSRIWRSACRTLLLHWLLRNSQG
jgi:hypothetical protein